MNKESYSPIWDIINRTFDAPERKENSRKTRFKFSKRYLLILVIFAVLVFGFYLSSKELFWTGTLSIVAIVLKFIRTRFNIPLEIEPVFFFSVILTRAYGLKYGIILEALAVFSINLINMDFTQSWIVGLIKPVLVLTGVALLGDSNLVIVGITMSIIRSILGMVMGLMAGVPVNAMLFVPLNPLVNIAYFWNIGRILESLLMQ